MAFSPSSIITSVCSLLSSAPDIFSRTPVDKKTYKTLCRQMSHNIDIGILLSTTEKETQLKHVTKRNYIDSRIQKRLLQLFLKYESKGWKEDKFSNLILTESIEQVQLKLFRHTNNSPCIASL